MLGFSPAVYRCPSGKSREYFGSVHRLGREVHHFAGAGLHVINTAPRMARNSNVCD